jgi:indole-3-glycerol phosphate synthase/phosphoribosylanthranilate isomerase
MSSAGVLERILARTRERVLERRRVYPLDRLQMAAPTPTGRRSFRGALSAPRQVNVIAEFKRRSPSRGLIRDDLEAVQVAQAYEIGGAAALSVLTEEQFFGGSLDDLKEARAATLLPTLRKDFIVDPYQVWEALAVGADAILLIVAALSDAELRKLSATAREAHLDVLVEVHDREELLRALDLGAAIIGVNNRNLHTMEVDLATALGLAPLIPDHVVAVAESGISGSADIRRLRDVGFDAFLIGEHLMRAPDPGVALEELLGECASDHGGRAGLPARLAVKICGITTLADARVAVEAGADAIGFVLWPGSPRCVSLETARDIADSLPPFVHRVGVFVNPTPQFLREACEVIGLDLIQLHGDQDLALIEPLPRRAIKAVNVGRGFDPEEALAFEGRVAGLLLDTKVDGALPGGTGRTFDWPLARVVRQRASYLLLAGGLTPDNVAEAVKVVRPDAVDVSSGVESSPGRKDAHKIRTFIRAARGEDR